MIELTNIKRVYHTGNEAVHALDGVDITIATGEYVAIVGRSGSGKSTLLNVLGCMDRPTHGTYLLAGENTAELDDDRLSALRNRHIGFVFQSFHLLPRITALENVKLPLRFSEDDDDVDGHDRAVTLLERVGLGNRMDHKPNEMSGGQRQRVAIARALINNPSVILADEPTGNLDSNTASDIMELFGELHAEGQTIVLVTHEPEMAEFAQRTIEMLDGKVVK